MYYLYQKTHIFKISKFKIFGQNTVRSQILEKLNLLSPESVIQLYFSTEVQGHPS